ncbi:DUF4312 family protein [Paenibacillus sp. N1-5-1-14]|uniref:DUF4312 family protein n=1 Tax=Paenibacillus radicibacter TaxID=2972488 RepID=UPI0021592134|nr:DUF4312 family protein [Paenibacillus radicibacter]MCR8644845.1 DUF4312 family protein [Paenibacillus radicibacter]
MYTEHEQVLTLSGHGETKHKAFQHVFNQVKTNLSKGNPDILLRIEPKDVEIVSAKVTTYTERFFGLLFPRQRSRYELTAKITVSIRTVKLSEVHFEEQPEKLSPIQRVLKMR